MSVFNPKYLVKLYETPTGINFLVLAEDGGYNPGKFMVIENSLNYNLSAFLEEGQISRLSNGHIIFGVPYSVLTSENVSKIEAAFNFLADEKFFEHEQVAKALATIKQASAKYYVSANITSIQNKTPKLEL